jgi:hypothetical protein
MTLTSAPPSLAERTRTPIEEPKVLFREARARRRRRWVGGAVLTIAALLAFIGLVASVRVGSADHLRSTPGRASAPLVLPSSGHSAAWVDYDGNLHVGQLAAGSQHTVAHAGASPTTPLVAIGDDIFWVRVGSVPSGRR